MVKRIVQSDSTRATTQDALGSKLARRLKRLLARQERQTGEFYLIGRQITRAMRRKARRLL